MQVEWLPHEGYETNSADWAALTDIRVISRAIYFMTFNASITDAEKRHSFLETTPHALVMVLWIFHILVCFASHRCGYNPNARKSLWQ